MTDKQPAAQPKPRIVARSSTSGKFVSLCAALADKVRSVVHRYHRKPKEKRDADG
jgi:hypothetical protein